jgi:hypothetical protein
MKRSLFKICLTLLLLCAASHAARAQTANADAQPNADVEVRLSLAGGRTVFRAGEPVRLVLSFKSDAAGYQVNTTTTKPASPIDEVVLSSDAGVTRWLDEYSAGGRYAPDYMAMQPLSPDPARVELVLNDWVRFDRPGRYRVRVKTARVLRPSPRNESGRFAPLLTNEVGFEVVAMSAAEEEREVRRLSASLDAAKGWQEQARVSEELSYLAGEPSTREKVRRYLASAGRDGNYTENILFGLVMARERALAVRLLEAALRDPERPVTLQLLSILTTLRVMLDGPAADAQAPPPSEPRYEFRRGGVLQEYVRELAASLPRRSGESRRATAMTLLLNMPKEQAQAAQIVSAVREILVREFESLNEYDRENLLRSNWDVIRDPALVPALERMLAGERRAKDFQLRAAALGRLIEFDRQRARPFVVAELRDADSFVDFDVLSSVGEETLPEADDALLAQVRAMGQAGAGFEAVRLRQRAMLAARFASPAVYDGLMEVYRLHGPKWQADARGALLGYFARYNEAQAAPLIAQALAETPEGQDQTFLIELTRSNYNDTVRALLRTLLEGEKASAGTAAFVMSLRGADADRALVEARLARWRKEWAGRAAELDAEGADASLREQVMLEVNLVGALTSYGPWKPGEDEARRLKLGCLTQTCRGNFPLR